VEEHLAEVEALLGETAAARARYQRLVSDTAAPSIWLALAELSEGAEAQALREQARRLQQAHLKLAPDAVGGHALEVLLATGDAPEAWRAETRARYQQAPQGDNALRLAQVEAAAGDVSAACEIVTGALAGGWRHAELHWWGAHCPNTGIGREQALRLNPRAAQLYALPASLSAGPAASAAARP
jgi:hypothetical protein